MAVAKKTDGSRPRRRLLLPSDLPACVHGAVEIGFDVRALRVQGSIQEQQFPAAVIPGDARGGQGEQGSVVLRPQDRVGAGPDPPDLTIKFEQDLDGAVELAQRAGLKAKEAGEAEVEQYPKAPLERVWRVQPSGRENGRPELVDLMT